MARLRSLHPADAANFILPVPAVGALWNGAIHHGDSRRRWRNIFPLQPLFSSWSFGQFPLAPLFLPCCFFSILMSFIFFISTCCAFSAATLTRAHTHTHSPISLRLVAVSGHEDRPHCRPGVWRVSPADPAAEKWRAGGRGGEGRGVGGSARWAHPHTHTHTPPVQFVLISVCPSCHTYSHGGSSCLPHPVMLESQHLDCTLHTYIHTYVFSFLAGLLLPHLWRFGLYSGFCVQQQRGWRCRTTTTLRPQPRRASSVSPPQTWRGAGRRPSATMARSGIVMWPSPCHSFCKRWDFWRAQINATVQNGKILLSRKVCCAA